MFAKAALTLMLSMGFAQLAAAADDPVEFFDEHSGATIIVVHDPLVFPLERSVSAGGTQRDFISLTAVEVDHSGELRLYIVGYIWSSSRHLAKSLVLSADEERVELAPLGEFPVELSDARKLLAPPLARLERAAYPVTAALLRKLAGSKSLKLVLADAPSGSDSGPSSFDVWLGRKSLAVFVERIDGGR